MARLHVNNHYTQALASKMADQLDPVTFREFERFLIQAERKKTAESGKKFNRFF